MKLPIVDEVRCIVCGKIYLRNIKTKTHSHRSQVVIRPVTSKTCSKKCSKIHNFQTKRKYGGLRYGKQRKKRVL